MNAAKNERIGAEAVDEVVSTQEATVNIADQVANQTTPQPAESPYGYHFNPVTGRPEYIFDPRDPQGGVGGLFTPGKVGFWGRPKKVATPSVATSNGDGQLRHGRGARVTDAAARRAVKALFSPGSQEPRLVLASNEAQVAVRREKLLRPATVLKMGRTALKGVANFGVSLFIPPQYEEQAFQKLRESEQTVVRMARATGRLARQLRRDQKRRNEVAQAAGIQYTAARVHGRQDPTNRIVHL